MQAPLPPGVTLQNRYRIVQLLGQGGFGRTYLAEDQGRFQERCALKEFVPQQGEDHFSSKATELFQREAAILYQIQHPQIPQFRAIFEVEQRLFLVQDYVDGVTYRDLLSQRRAQNNPFNESEVRQFLQQILPVLAHIHAKGIIHRDISPDNIMLRNGDRLPVLIDFGVVKEVVTRIQMPETTVPATTVGKIGYAPSEQIQSGRAYPSSDLYALAVTAVVLLTGQEPQSLFDDVNLSWHWQQYATVSPGLAQVLNKALSYRPGDRFQSVSEMAQALGSALTTGSIPTGIPTGSATAPASPPLSQARTVAVGRAYQPTAGVTPGARVTHAAAPTPAAEPESVWENPWAVSAMGIGLALVAGISGWGIVNALNNAGPEPTTTPSASITINPSPETTAPTPTPTAVEPVAYSQQITVGEGENIELEGSLRSNETVNYQLQGQQGQTLRVQLSGEGVLLTVLAPNGNPADGQASRVLGWSGPLEFTGQYVIQLSPVQGLTDSNYKLTVAVEGPVVEPPAPEETPEPPPEEQPVEPSVSEQRVRIPQGQTSMRVANGVGPGQIQRYVVNLRQGQVLSANLEAASGPVLLAISLPSGEVLSGAAQVRSWEGQVPLGGDYTIEVSSEQAAEFTLNIGARN
ncbi:MAG: serine/threonine protein kinase [Leptolyngbya sp. RL_3_1]|nr:serine/threonine protein kinase [Leptolyngbya sp. RL_3_1]